MPKVNKTCFLVSPIGASGSATRQRVDQWMSLIYEPALNSEYKIIRADQISSPGFITEQILEHLVGADLVIIDFTEMNSNVMYEAAVRHLVQKPFIQIHEQGMRLPFDVHNLRSISYDSNDLTYPPKLVEEIRKSIEAINDPGYELPQLIKEKFDFNKIISDPEKFVKLMLKHLKITESSENASEDSIVTVADNYPGFFLDSATSTSLRTKKKIVCPKCKTIKYIDSSPWWGIEGAATYTAAFPGVSGYHYKCNNCGTEFGE